MIIRNKQIRQHTLIMNTTKSPNEKAFNFVKILESPPKPRHDGIIEIRGPYYSAVTITYLQDLLDMWGDYIDGFKFAGGSQRLLSIEILKKIIYIFHKYDVYVSTGGVFEKGKIKSSWAG